MHVTFKVHQISLHPTPFFSLLFTESIKDLLTMRTALQADGLSAECRSKHLFKEKYCK